MNRIRGLTMRIKAPSGKKTKQPIFFQKNRLFFLPVLLYLKTERF